MRDKNKKSNRFFTLELYPKYMNFFSIGCLCSVCLIHVGVFASSCCDQIPSRMDERSTPQDMVWIPAGTFTMGGEVADCMKDWPETARSRPDERPLHRVALDGFWMSRTPVTNAEFMKFVHETGYITTAEKHLEAEESDICIMSSTEITSSQVYQPSSLVFIRPSTSVSHMNALSWWQWKEGANWRQPEGDGSSITNRLDHPVVHISYYDAKAYAAWKGMSLPTEAQWEYAARAGFEQQVFVWGKEPVKEEAPRINIWQGKFPIHNTQADGYMTTSPVTSFSANAYGLYDMSGNVWEWVLDWYHVDAYAMRNGVEVVKNPQGPMSSYDPDEPDISKRVLRGGSFLCNDAYCSGYRPAARMKSSPDTSANHIGFRVVKNSLPKGEE